MALRIHFWNQKEDRNKIECTFWCFEAPCHIRAQEDTKCSCNENINGTPQLGVLVEMVVLVANTHKGTVCAQLLAGLSMYCYTNTAVQGSVPGSVRSQQEASAAVPGARLRLTRRAYTAGGGLRLRKVPFVVISKVRGSAGGVRWRARACGTRGKTLVWLHWNAKAKKPRYALELILFLLDASCGKGSNERKDGGPGGAMRRGVRGGERGSEDARQCCESLCSRCRKLRSGAPPWSRGGGWERSLSTEVVLCTFPVHILGCSAKSVSLRKIAWFGVALCGTV